MADGDAASKLPLAIAGLDRGGAELEVARRTLCQRHECRGGKYKKEKDGEMLMAVSPLRRQGSPMGRLSRPSGSPAPSLLTC